MSASDLVEQSGIEPTGAAGVSILSTLGLVSQDDVSAAAMLVSVKKCIGALPGLALGHAAIAGAVAFGSPMAHSLTGSGFVIGFAALSLLSLLSWALLRAKPAKALRPTHKSFLLLPLFTATGLVLGLAMSGALQAGLITQPPIAVAVTLIGLSVAFAIGALPVLQVTLISTLSAAVIVAGTGAGMNVLFAVLGGGVIPVLIARLNADRQALNASAREVMSMSKASALITMIEESDRIWFWETDRNGALTYASPKLLASFNKTPNEILGTRITSLFLNVGDGTERSQNADRTVNFYLSNRLGFSDFPVQAAMSDTDQWWSITGRPVLDSAGRFRGFRGSGTDLTERRRSEQEINRLAWYDSLTGLPNRLFMLQTLEQALANARVNPVKCILMLLDLDRFKGVNDTLGHPVGDQLLKQVAKRLETVVGSKGRVGRFGGDEFTVVLPIAPTRAEAKTLGKDIILALSQPYTIEGSYISIGASVGIAVGTDDGESAEAIMRNADLALYAAKSGGRGIVRFFESSMRSVAEDRRSVEIDLQNALPTGQFSLVYQPVVCSVTESVVGFETLIRWTHPEKGPISPALFIPIAEDIGLIKQIGDWVLRNACFEAAKWPSNAKVAVNVSAIQFTDPGFPTSVMHALAQSQLDPGRLELEITESVFLDESADLDAMFAKLKSIGVRLALDDFGTGYSSLGYLKKAPFDKIKIDRSFVEGAAISGNRNAAIIKSVVSLAESLGMDTTAEGAETMDELELIRSLGCSHIQGYIFGKPMTAADAIALLNDNENAAVEAKGFDKSRAPRIRMLRSATLICAGRRLNVRVRNVSTTGVQIEIGSPIAIGTKVSLDLGLSSPLECEVRWSAGGRMGMAFSGPIDLSRLSSPTAPPRLRAAS
jgi:diguanylate cyclase (GGDEF)-like protein